MSRCRGVVKHWDAKRGFGFVAPDNGDCDVFVHISNCAVDGAALPRGALVEFEIGTASDGRSFAKSLALVTGK
jgi:cold shock protein